MSMLLTNQLDESKTTGPNDGHDSHPTAPNLHFVDKIVREGNTVLTEQEAREIFSLKPNPLGTPTPNRAHTVALANAYGVSIKTIRDIWVGRTWFRSTFDLDPSQPASPARLQKQLGRPKGSKDTKPRIRKTLKSPQTETSHILQSDSAKNVEWNGKSNAGSAVGTDSRLPCNSETCRPSSQHACDGSPVNQQTSVDFHLPTRQLPTDQLVPDVKEPCSSTANGAGDFGDPFHDDWPYWPQRDSRR
jgi:hypothetical protein